MNTTWITETTKQEIIIPEENTSLQEASAQEKWIKQHLLDDKILADSLNHIALNAKKTITTKDDWSWEVPDYTSRLKALDMQFKMKGHYEDNSVWEELPDWIYLFAKKTPKKIDN